MAQQPWFNVFRGERGREQCVVEKVNLPNAEVIGSPPVGVQPI
jgi:hypothetical protein